MVKMLRKTKKAIAAVLTAGMLAGMLSTPVVAADAGWKKDNTGWWYQNADGSYPKNQWEKIDGAWYYFNEKGYILQNSWKKDTDGTWYYLGASGAMKKNAWISEYDKGYEKAYMWNWNHEKDSLDWYYVGANGAMQTNTWVKDGGSWYYLKDDGTMHEGGFIEDAGKTYYVDYNGVMQTGLIEDNFCAYYFGTDGAMRTGNVTINGKNYYFSQSYGCDDAISLVAKNKRFVDGIPCGGEWHQIGYGDYTMHFTCQKEKCTGCKGVDFTMLDGEYFNVCQDLYDYGRTSAVDGEWEAHLYYREGNYMDAYNSCKKTWNVSSEGTIATPCGTMKYILERNNDGTADMAGFVQVDEKHYVRIYFEYRVNESESKVVSDFTKLAKKVS